MSSFVTAAPRDPADRGLDPWRVAGLIEATSASVIAELRALGDELGQRRPIPGEWCANECAGHLLEATRNGFADRIRRILAEDGVYEPGWEQTAVAEARRDHERPVEALVLEFVAVRADAAALVRSLQADQLALHAVHAAVGRITVRDLLQEWVFHDREHLRQLLECAQARVWPAMGNTRAFDIPDA